MNESPTRQRPQAKPRLGGCLFLLLIVLLPLRAVADWYLGIGVFADFAQTLLLSLILLTLMAGWEVRQRGHD